VDAIFGWDFAGGSDTHPAWGMTAEISTMASDKPHKYDWRGKMKEPAETEQPAEKVEKYDWRAKIREDAGIVETAEPTERRDWKSKIKEAVGLAPSAVCDERVCDWRFKKTIAGAIRIVRAEQEAEREREMARKARLAKARNKAAAVHERVIMPLLHRLRDDFATNEKSMLSGWHIQAGGDADRFQGEVTAPFLEADDGTRFAIKAEASVMEPGDFVSVSVSCSAVDPKSASASQVAPLFEKKAKFPTVQLFDELGSRTWFHAQLAECVRMCVLTSLRQSTRRP
jgi:hypothetical protein